MKHLTILVVAIGVMILAACGEATSPAASTTADLEATVQATLVSPTSKSAPLVTSNAIPAAQQTIPPKAVATIQSLIDSSSQPTPSSGTQAIARQMANNTDSSWTEAQEVEGFAFVLEDLVKICPEVSSVSSARSKYEGLYRQVSGDIESWENLLSVSESIHYILKRGFRENNSRALPNGYCTETFQAYYGSRSKWYLSEWETEDLLIPVVENDMR